MTQAQASLPLGWECLLTVRWPYPGLDAASAAKIEQAANDGTDCFSFWPPVWQRRVFWSLDQGVEKGHVTSGYDKASVKGLAKFGDDFMELRATWTPPA